MFDYSSGVSMFAMLTGNLPFTVEPFTIRALHSKMIKGEMNPIPDHMSKGKQIAFYLLNLNLFEYFYSTNCQSVIRATDVAGPEGM